MGIWKWERSGHTGGVHTAGVEVSWRRTGHRLELFQLHRSALNPCSSFPASHYYKYKQQFIFPGKDLWKFFLGIWGFSRWGRMRGQLSKPWICAGEVVLGWDFSLKPIEAAGLGGPK